MTLLNNLPHDDARIAANRIANFKRMFAQVRKLMAIHATHSGVRGFLTPDELSEKLEELQRLQALLRDAEEVLNDVFAQQGSGGLPDYADLRVAIGGQLDRLRTTLGTKTFPQGDEPS